MGRCPYEVAKTGIAAPEECLPNLLQIIRSGSVTLRPAEVSFRRGWEEAMAGETKPVFGLWEGVDAEAKKYRYIHSDVQPVIDQLRAGEVEFGV